MILSQSLLSLCDHDVCDQINMYQIITSEWLTLWIKLKVQYSPIITFFPKYRLTSFKNKIENTIDWQVTGRR